MDLFPAVDLRQGRVVRLTQGDDGRRSDYGGDPAQRLQEFGAAGLRWAHVVDLDAALGGVRQRELIEELVPVAKRSGMAIQLGGGLASREDLNWAFEAGVDRCVLGSLVARQPDHFAELVSEFPERLVAALDVADGQVRVSGWLEGAGRSLEQLCEALRGLSCPAVLVTDITRDGTLEGPNLDLTGWVGEATGIPALVSGGVRGLGDLLAAATTPGVGGVVFGKAIYENRLDLSAVRAVFEEAGR